MKKNDLLAAIESTKTRSAWERGVKEYAVELVENLNADDIPECRRDLEKLLLSGAETWDDYSWGGCSLIYNQDIARRLCSPSELRRSRNGERKPNGREQWLDTQARALYHASNLIYQQI
jgi:hypothetical protein